MPCCSDAAFFTDLARDTVEPLLKMLFRSFGDNQDLFGFSCSTPEEEPKLKTHKDKATRHVGKMPEVSTGLEPRLHGTLPSVRGASTDVSGAPPSGLVTACQPP